MMVAIITTSLPTGAITWLGLTEMPHWPGGAGIPGDGGNAPGGTAALPGTSSRSPVGSILGRLQFAHPAVSGAQNSQSQKQVLTGAQQKRLNRCADMNTQRRHGERENIAVL
ncbi:MAG: hypothetical protein WD063_12430 [Pirellulales bacterium]